MSRHGKVGRGSRLFITLQVLLAGVLALAVLLMVNWLAGRPGMRVRIDMTAKERNSLDEVSRLVLDSLREPVQMDVFFRPERKPLDVVVADAQARTLRLLVLMESAAAGRIEVRINDLSDRVATQERLEQLRIRGLANCVIVSQGRSREVVGLDSHLATFELGNPNPEAYRPPSLADYRGERALIEGILKVTRGERPKVLFLDGHGEPDMIGETEEELGRLHATLRDDGLELERWNPLEDGEIPADTVAIAVVGPTAPLGEELIDDLEAFALEGGRLLLAPPANVTDLKRSGITTLCDRFGVEVGEGTVMQIHINPETKRLGFGQECQWYDALPQRMVRHPILDAIQGTGQSFKLVRMHPVRVVRQIGASQARSVPLLSTDPQLSWLDDPYPLNFQWEEALEDRRAFDVMAACQFVPDDVLRAVVAQGAQSNATRKTESRVVVLGSSDMLINVMHNFNADVALASFNWLVDREWRVPVSPKDPDRRILPVAKRGNVVHFALWVLPALALLGGLITAFRRSR